METKFCSRCEQEKPVSEFSKNSKRSDGLQKYCKSCMAEYNRLHYQKKKDVYRTKATERVNECREQLNDIKSYLKCSICGESRLWVLDFHHVNPDEKEDSISNLVHTGNIDKIKKEMEKCIVLCANCHRDLHYKQLHPDLE